MSQSDRKQYIHLPMAISIALLLGGCAKSTEQDISETTVENDQTINQPEAIAPPPEPVKPKPSKPEPVEPAIESQVAKNSANAPLLPPNAKTGECYARVWVEPKYEQYEERMLVAEASEKVETQAARYAAVEERVLVSAASQKFETIPASYKSVKEKVLIAEAERNWRLRPTTSAELASDELLRRAQAHGINLDAAKNKMCYHEHKLAGDVEYIEEQVLVSEESEKTIHIPAQYRTVEKKVLVKEESVRYEPIPATYETVVEQILDKPAHQVWKKGTGAIQKIDEATGEIMCLVDVPATYRSVEKKVLKSPATTREIVTPAVYKTIEVQELVTPAREQTIKIPAKYTSVKKKKALGEARYVWHEVHDKTHTKMSRTGNQICLVETPAEYKTVTKQVVAAPAYTKAIDIPAVYKTVKVEKLVQPAKLKRIDIPAKYENIQRNKLIEEGRMEWRSILCETNMTKARIKDVQMALESRGYNPGPIDGVVGSQTMAAINKFQRASNLPVDEYLNIETIEALNISTQ